jgi:single-stranded DNA-binding protein
MAGSVNKVILVGNLGKDPDGWQGHRQSVAGHNGFLARQGLWRAQGKDRMAPRGDFQ